MHNYNDVESSGDATECLRWESEDEMVHIEDDLRGAQTMHMFTVDRESRVYRFQTIDGTLIVHRDTFLHAVQTYQEQFRMSRRAALHRAIKVQYWCADYWQRGEQVLTSYYV